MNELNRQILVKIDFLEKYYDLDWLFFRKTDEIYQFKRPEIKQVFKSLGYKVATGSGRTYQIQKSFDSFTFKFTFFISSYPIPYLYIFKDEVYLKSSPGILNSLSLFESLGYKKERMNPNFGLNNTEDLKEYLKRTIAIIDEFIVEYMKEIENGYEPEK